MAAFALTVPLKGPCFPATGLSGGQNPPLSSRLRDRRNGAVPSVAWSMGSGARGTKLKAQVAKWVPQNDDYLYDARALHIELMVFLFGNIHRPSQQDTLSGSSGRTKPEVTDQRKRHKEAREKRSRDLVDGLMEYISSDNENYKYIIIASKENANMIMEEGFISSDDRDEILDGLARIEKDIEEGKFQWRNNKDIRTDIVEALIDIVEGPAKRLDAVISHYDQMLAVLNLWCNDSIDKFVAQIKELQVELVLLAIRNEGLVVHCDNRNAYCILLGDMVLLKVEQLENDVCRLVSCKNKMDSTRLTPFPSGSTDGSMNSLSNGGLHYVHNSIMDFGNLIVGDIAHDLTDLGNELHTLKIRSLTPNDELTKNLELMWRHNIDLDIFRVIGHSGSIYNEAADSSKRFLKAYKVVPEMIKAAREFTRNSSFDPEKFLRFPPGFAGDPKLAGFRASKGLERLYGGETAVEQRGAVEVKRDFKSHSDDTTGKLLQWFRRLHQSE